MNKFLIILMLVCFQAKAQVFRTLFNSTNFSVTAGPTINSSNINLGTNAMTWTSFLTNANGGTNVMTYTGFATNWNTNQFNTTYPLMIRSNAGISRLILTNGVTLLHPVNFTTAGQMASVASSPLGTNGMLITPGQAGFWVSGRILLLSSGSETMPSFTETSYTNSGFNILSTGFDITDGGTNVARFSTNATRLYTISTNSVGVTNKVSNDTYFDLLGTYPSNSAVRFMSTGTNRYSLNHKASTDRFEIRHLNTNLVEIFDGSFIPSTDLTMGLGGGSFRWASIRAGNMTLSGTTPAASGNILLDVAGTWNDVAQTMVASKVNITDTASASASLLQDLQVGGSSKFSVRKDGRVDAAGVVYGGGGLTTYSEARVGSVHFVSGGDISTGVTITVGAGSPEGVVTAGGGSLFLRTDGGSSTSLYVKVGGGATGWNAK